MHREQLFARLDTNTLLTAAHHAANAITIHERKNGGDWSWLYQHAIETEDERRRWARRVIAEAVFVGAFPSHPAGWGPEVVMKLWPRHVAHVICESLGYCTPTSAAHLVADAVLGRGNWCEWLADMAMKRRANQKLTESFDDTVKTCTKDVVRWSVQNKIVSVWHRFNGRHLLPAEITPDIAAEISAFRDDIRREDKGRDYYYKDVQIPAPGGASPDADLYLTIQVQKSGRRHTHRGYMAELKNAEALVAHAAAGKGEPAFASWF